MVHEDVKRAVLAWAGAPDLDDAARQLAKHRRRLDAELVDELTHEIAEISAETLIELIAMERDVIPGPTVEILGLALYPKQAERVAAWVEDQEPTTTALGIDPDDWGAIVERGLRKYVARERGNVEARTRQASDLIGAARKNRFAPPRRESSGLSGLLAARTFGRKSN